VTQQAMIKELMLATKNLSCFSFKQGIISRNKQNSYLFVNVAVCWPKNNGINLLNNRQTVKRFYFAHFKID